MNAWVIQNRLSLIFKELKITHVLFFGWLLKFIKILSSVQPLSLITLCNPMDCCTPGFPAHHQLPELAQTHIHWVSDAIQPSHPLSSTSPPDFNLSQHQGLFPMSRLFTSGGPSFRASASASVLSVNIHDLFPLQLIFSPRDSQESFLAPEF